MSYFFCENFYFPTIITYKLIFLVFVLYPPHIPGPLHPPSSRGQWTAWPACSVCWGKVLCHHMGTRAPVPAIMLDYWWPAENSFVLVYSVMRRAGSLSLTKMILKIITRRHRQTNGGAPCLWIIYRHFLTRGKGVLHCNSNTTTKLHP